MKKMITAGALALALIATTGCSVMYYLDGSSQKKIDEFLSDEQIAKSRGKAIEPETIGTLDELKMLKARIAVLERRPAVQPTEQAEIARLTEELEQTKQRIAELDAMLKTRPVPEPAPVAPVSEPSVPETAQTDSATRTETSVDSAKHIGGMTPSPANTHSASEIKIKVLSGDGKIESARAMADRLIGIGHSIGRIDLTPRPNFSSDTVFFSQAYRADAVRLSERLGIAPENIKPLTWHSVFDIIVVNIGE